MSHFHWMYNKCHIWEDTSPDVDMREFAHVLNICVYFAVVWRDYLFARITMSRICDMEQAEHINTFQRLMHSTLLPSVSFQLIHQSLMNQLKAHESSKMGVM